MRTKIISISFFLGGMIFLISAKSNQKGELILVPDKKYQIKFPEGGNITISLDSKGMLRSEYAAKDLAIMTSIINVDNPSVVTSISYIRPRESEGYLYQVNNPDFVDEDAFREFSKVKLSEGE